MARFFVLRTAAFALGCLASLHARGAEPLDEVAATRRICAGGPSAGIARAQRLRGSAEVSAADVLPNPSFVAEHQRSLTGPTERETILGLSVALGIGGRRFLLQDAAAGRQDQARADAQATLFDSALEFREAYVKALIERARVEVLAEQQAALDELSTTIQGLAKGGEAAGYDLLRQQAQSRLHRTSLESAKARALAARATLEAWTEREVTLPSGELSNATGVALAEKFTGRARDTARIRSLEASSRASSIEAQAARRRWVPDLEVFAGYRQLTTGQEIGHGISLGVTVPLTFFDHGQGEAARAEAEREIALTTVAKLRREQRADLKAARIQMDGLVAALAEADKAIADAALVQTKARQLYAAGEASITELLEAFRGAEEARLTRLELTQALAGARLSLMGAMGTMFDPALDEACRGEGRGQ